MQDLATCTQPSSPGRLLARGEAGAPPLVPALLLTRGAWLRAFGPFRLPGYRPISYRLADLAGWLRVATLWTAIFGDNPPANLDSEDLTHQLVWRVNDELFPVDLVGMDRNQQCLWDIDMDDEEYEDDPPAESILDMPIPIQGYGIPWELADMGDTDHAARPLLAVVAHHLPLTSAFRGCEESFYNSVDVYWADLSLSPPPWNLSPKQAGLSLLRSALSLLPAPFDGLAGVLACACKNSGNMFLDAVSGDYSGEYCDDWSWDWDRVWNAGTIQDYAAAFARVRPIVEKIDAYDKWYCETPDAGRQVLAILARLVAGNWHIEEDQIIYHD